MDLSEDQITILKERADAGAQLNDLQKVIQTEFEKSITFMETRFLISDLGITIKKNEPEKKNEEEAPDPASEEGVEDDALENEEAVGGVSVSVDKLKRPGMLASGSVAWSDGVTSVWFLDQSGQLGLDSDDETYQPSPDDVQDFQLKLQKLLRP